MIKPLPDEHLKTISVFPIAVLGLSVRPTNVLEKEGVDLIGDLLRCIEDRQLDGFRGLGALSAREILSKTDCFIEAARSMHAGRLDELRDPRPELEVNLPSHGPPNLLDLLANIAQKCATHTRDYDVLKWRFGLEDGKQHSLEDIGSFFGITRERVRQIESRIVKRLRATLLGDLDDAPWKVPSAISNEFARLRSLLTSGLIFISEQKARCLLEEHYGLLDHKQQPAVPLLLLLLGAKHIAPEGLGFTKTQGSFWLWTKDHPPQRIAILVKGISGAFETTVRPLPLFDISVHVNKRRKERFNRDQILMALRGFIEIEEVGEEEFQVRPECLKTIPDRACRILLQAGVPLSFREIVKQINSIDVSTGSRPSIKRPTSISNKLSKDPRFEPVGKSGIWKLSEWQEVRTDSIVDLMREALICKGETASYQEVCDYVVRFRAGVRRKTIYSLANIEEDIFCRLPGGMLELVEWGNHSSGSKSCYHTSEEVKSQLDALIRDLIRERATSELPLADVVREAIARTSLSDPTVRARLVREPWATIIGPKHRRILRVNLDQMSDHQESVHQWAPVRRKTEALVREILAEAHSSEVLLADIWKQLRKQHRIPKASTYSVISKMSDIQKTKRSGRVYCGFKSPPGQFPPFPGIEQISDPEHKKALETARENLTIENVDMALFQLGRVFEITLGRVLEKAKQTGAYTVSRKDKSTLSSKIDWLVKNALVTRGHNLDVLREQRNKRAHGEVPSEEERQKLLDHAHFLVDLYMEYILKLQAVAASI